MRTPTTPPHHHRQNAIHPPPTSPFTHRNLTHLTTYNPRTPLRLITHIDLDAFYAQCEIVRLHLPPTTPLAVQQWHSLIAVNYAARPFGISRMLSAAEARKRCPQLVTQHVATFREGEGGRWAYREDAAERMGSDKVSLEPYRVESRRILGVVRGVLEGWAGRVDLRGDGERGKGMVGGGGASGGDGGEYAHLVRIEKAGIDEVFVDLSALVHAALLQRYPVLAEGERPREPGEKLPRPPTTVLAWRPEDCLVDLDVEEAEEDDPDWDDVAMLVAADIVRDIRQAVWERLKYTCSAGIARNKMMAKLGSACNKPNKQTIVRNRAVQQFLGGFKFTKIRMLGGKLGRHVVETFGTDEVAELLKVSLEQMRSKLGDETGPWLYQLIRGEEYSEVTTRTKIKSMLSTKSFRPGITSIGQAEKWLRIFVADIYGRLVEEGVAENKRRPKVITIHHRMPEGQSRSRQIPIPTGKPVTDDLLFELAKVLLTQVIGEGNIWPCANLSLNVGGFEDGETGMRRLDSFFLPGNKGPKSDVPLAQDHFDTVAPDTAKRRKISDYPYNDIHSEPLQYPLLSELQDEESLFLQDEALDQANMSEAHHHLLETDIQEEKSPPSFLPSFTCPRCGKTVLEYESGEHEDWHFAKDLDTQERQQQRQQHPTPPPPPRQSGGRGGKGRGRGRGRGGRGKVDKRQSRLAFG
ncbi:DNA-directed DNA polymerase eta rad30 [Onygenales sp. PD_12]|nr:DNA-directed DNA polymerase eta rad30 [Onygenales sp. PD_12]